MCLIGIQIDRQLKNLILYLSLALVMLGLNGFLLLEPKKTFFYTLKRLLLEP
jgi:hypothetical protein